MTRAGDTKWDQASEKWRYLHVIDFYTNFIEKRKQFDEWISLHSKLWTTDWICFCLHRIILWVCVSRNLITPNYILAWFYNITLFTLILFYWILFILLLFFVLIWFNIDKNILHHQNYFQTYISSNLNKDGNNYSWKASFTARKRKIQQSCSNFPITKYLFFKYYPSFLQHIHYWNQMFLLHVVVMGFMNVEAHVADAVRVQAGNYCHIEGRSVFLRRIDYVPMYMYQC